MVFLGPRPGTMEVNRPPGWVSTPVQPWATKPRPPCPPDAGGLPVVAGIQLSLCSRGVELPTQLAGALTAGQAAGVVQEKARRAGAARGAEAGALNLRVLSQAQLRAGAPVPLALLCGAEHHVPRALSWTGRQSGSQHGQEERVRRGRGKRKLQSGDQEARGSPSHLPPVQAHSCTRKDSQLCLTLTQTSFYFFYLLDLFLFAGGGEQRGRKRES